MDKRHLFGMLFVILFLGVIIVIVVCFIAKNGKREDETEVPELPFWKTSIIYQIYPRSFQDSDSDGTGDIAGIISRLDYLKDLGVGVVWLSPVYQSPMKDFGYDISNYTAIDPIFGTMDDFDRLIRGLHDRGMKLVMDFVPNHSSDQHEWFQRALNLEEPYVNYYVWDQGTTDDNGTIYPPNNWVSKSGDSAWEWINTTAKYYYHHYLKEQPDLNYRSQQLRTQMEAVLTFWLDKEVDGFRVDALAHLVETQDLSLNNPVNPDSGTNDTSDPDYYIPLYTDNQPETYLVLHTWRQLLDKYNDKLLMVEVTSDVEEVMRYYGNDTYPLADFPFNFFLIDNFHNRSDLTGYALKNTVDLWMDNMPHGKWPNWVLGNHDNWRVSSRLGKDLVDALNMFNLLLPGTPVTYYGEELGMENTNISWEDTQDPEGCYWGQEHYQEHSRDPERTPMQWDNTSMAGFTNYTWTWLPVNPNYLALNVAMQEAAEVSHLKIYRSLATLRQKDVFLNGVTAFPVITNNIFSFIRSESEGDKYLIVINTGQEEVIINLHHHSNFPLPDTATVIIRSLHDDNTLTQIGSQLSLDEVLMVEGGGLVLQFP